MNILVIGSGGREHALVHALWKSPKCEKIFCLPGNAGINSIAEEVLIPASDFAAIAEFCKEEAVDLVVIGPEAPLVDGIVDYLEGKKIRVFGTNEAAAMLEGSKDFTKTICIKYGIPTAGYKTFKTPKKAKAYIDEKGVPIVVKVDGLAGGKGVTVARTLEEAHHAVNEIVRGKFGAEASKKIIVEDFLKGEEVSFFAICDGKTAIPFGSAQDHKAVGEGDTGPNTGGMGTYSPAPLVDDKLQKKIIEKIMNPVIEGMKKEGKPFKGVLFMGLMIDEGEPRLIEINVRFGDPETQVLLPRLQSDLIDLLVAACDGELAGREVQLSEKTALCVVMASKGYPEKHKAGTVIEDIEHAELLENVMIYHAGTAIGDGGELLATGGRVLGITATGNDVLEAQKQAYKAVDLVKWDQGFCRRDIGWRAIEKLKLAS